jgi:hypothetical protein
VEEPVVKAWDIIGYTYHAAAYCDGCGAGLPEVDPEGNKKHPIFAVDDVPADWTCDACHEPILDIGE